MRITRGSLLAGALVLATSACGIATTAGYDSAPSLDFGRYSTFAWDETRVAEADDVRLKSNPFFEERLFEAVERELFNRDIWRDDDDPELLVHYHLSVEDHVEVFGADRRWDRAEGEYGPGTDVLQYEMGTFVVHFIDAATEEDLWISWAQGDIGAALNDSVKMREWVEEAVALMFEDFPVLTIRRER